MTKKEQPADDAGGPISRLLKRHVIQAIAIYVAVAWGAIEILLTMQERLGWPEWLSRVALALFIAGFPVVVIWSWFRDLQSRWAKSGVVVLAIALAGGAFLVTLTSDPVARAPAAKLPPVSEAIATVAVLPFENGTGDPAYDYLASGFTGELIGRLSKHPDLAVIQEESVRAPLLASLIPVAQASTLNANYIVQGRVVREDKFIEVTASLQDLDGQILWSEILREAYAADTILAMQRRISGEVSRVLGTTLDAPAYCGETTDLNAMELYYRGRMKVGTRITETMEEGMELLKQAVEADPYFGRGWSQLGSAQLILAGRMQDPVDGDRQRAGMLWSMMQTSFRRALEICPTIGMAYKVVVPSYDGIDNEAIDQEMQYRDSLAMDPNDAGLLRQYAFHLMQHGMNEEAIDVMRRAYDNEPLMAMIPRQLAHALMKLGYCDEALPLAAEAEELGGQPKVAVEATCAWRRRDIDALNSAGYRFKEIGFGFPYEAMEMSVEEFNEARLDENSPLRPVMAERLRALWEENPDKQKNMHVYWIVATATDIGDLDLVFDILDSIVNDHGFPGYTIAWSPLFVNSKDGSQLRSDPRFVAMLEKTVYPEYWRQYGWPTGCEADGDSFRCF